MKNGLSKTAKSIKIQGESKLPQLESVFAKMKSGEKRKFEVMPFKLNISNRHSQMRKRLKENNENDLKKVATKDPSLKQLR